MVRHFSPGLIVGTLFFAISLTPTLLPRTDLVQGIISGLSLAAGYGIGVLGHALWRYLELPAFSASVRRIVQWVATSLCILLAALFLWRASDWQNGVRALMEMEEAGRVQPLVVGGVALTMFLALLAAGRLFRWAFLLPSRKLRHYVPRRVSTFAGLLLAFVVFWSLVEGVLFSMALRAADGSYQQIDALMEPDFPAPGDPLRAGSAESLLAWEGMGRQGRRFISRGPTAEEVREHAGEPAASPMRVYVGLNAAETLEERAELALEELKRTDAFGRSVLVLITPTGTGWVDEAAMKPLEYLHRGDVASVAAQYSYLPSPLALMSEGAYGAEMARALFEKVYGHWSRLPRGNRPELYLYGLSLGALNSDRSFDLYDIIDDPFRGVLWSGPPYRSETWRSITERRRPGSPAWRPRFRDDSVVRFANQDGGLEQGRNEWGSFRMAFLQYASDPVTFFSPGSFYREPDWMKEPRGPDVSDELRWFPIVTMLQLAADMIAGTSPTGYGHKYAPEHYLDAWVALTEPPGWSDEALARLRERLAAD